MKKAQKTVTTYIDKISNINFGSLSSSTVVSIREKMPNGDKLKN